MARCEVCFRHCEIEEGKTGFCLARTCSGGVVKPANYGKITASALDPIEKKPLRHFHPGSMIFSIGSYGCNLRCPFCQNHTISWSEKAAVFADRANGSAGGSSPEDIVQAAVRLKQRGNIGIAFTYNEPLIGWEFVRDTAKLAKEQGLLNVMVTNGTASTDVLRQLLPYIDAMNIDLKAFTDRFYSQLIKGDLDMVKSFIQEAVRSCHVELTTLVIPGENDSVAEIRKLSSWIAGLDGIVPGKEIPLHISRFFPAFHMTDRSATSVAQVYRLAEAARENLHYVYTGNC